MIETPGFCHSLIQPQKSPPLVPESASRAQGNEVGEDAVIWRYQSKDMPSVVSRNAKGRARQGWPTLPAFCIFGFSSL